MTVVQREAASGFKAAHGHNRDPMVGRVESAAIAWFGFLLSLLHVFGSYDLSHRHFDDGNVLLRR
jgi:hypothetical protein